MNAENLQSLRELAQEAEDFRKLQAGTIDNMDLRTAYHKRLQAYVNALYESPATILSLLVEVERLNNSLKYEQHRTGRQGAHADGCYTWGPEHYECAMEEIKSLRCCGNCKHGMKESCKELIVVGWGMCDGWEGMK